MIRTTMTLLASFIVVLSVGDVTAVIVVGDSGDGTVDVNGLPQDLADPITRVGTGGNNLRGLAAVYFFELPTFSSLTTITNAQLQIEYLGISPSSNTVTPEFNVDLFGIDTRPDAIIQSGDYYDGDAAFSSDVLIQTAMVTPTTASGNLSITNLSLLNFVKSLYNVDGTPISTFAAFRLNADIDLPVNSNPLRGYDVALADNATDSFRPRLTLTGDVIPEPSSFVLCSISLCALAAVPLRRRKTA